MVSTTIAAQKGRAFLLKIATGVSPINYKTVTGLRQTGLVINGNPVDITSKTSNGWQELLPDAGVKSVDISGSGVYDANSSQLLALQTAALNGGQIVEAQVVSGAGDSFQGEWSVASFNRDGAHNGEETYTIALKSHGLITHTPAS